MGTILFRDRAEAGCILGGRLRKVLRDQDILVLALSRGGVPVGFEIALALESDLDIFPVRKLGIPGYKQLALGFIASGGICVLNRSLIEQLRIPQSAVDEATERETLEIFRREALYRQGRPRARVANRTIVLVDDALASEARMVAAVRALTPQEPEKIFVGVPVAAPETCGRFQKYVDRTLCIATPETFHAAGVWYDSFPQTSSDEVRDLLARAARLHGADRPQVLASPQLTLARQ